jgi:hypothetical protein
MVLDAHPADYSLMMQKNRALQKTGAIAGIWPRRCAPGLVMQETFELSSRARRAVAIPNEKVRV